MRNFPWCHVVTTILMYVSVLVFCAGFLATDCLATTDDEDGNGFNDRYEQQIVNMFCPSLILHKGEKDNMLAQTCPEPVEIITGNIWGHVHCPPSGAFCGDALWDLPLGNYSHFNNDNDNIFSGIDTYNCGYVSGNGIVDWQFDYGGPSLECDPLGGFNDYPGGWYEIYKYGNQWTGAGEDYPHTIYAHLFSRDGELVIQYWFFYPFNDWVNDHEGDWEHINVIVTSDDPRVAEINRVIYYFHHHFVVCTTNQLQDQFDFDYFVVDDTHPVVCAGGYAYMNHLNWIIGDGFASHGSYPYPATWEGVDLHTFLAFIQYQKIDEAVDGLGDHISYCDFICASQDDNYGVVLLKEIGFYNYDLNPEMSWFKANVYWGHRTVHSAGDALANMGNQAPVGPAHHDGWNLIDALVPAFTLYLFNSPVMDPSWAPPSTPAGPARDLLLSPIDGSTPTGTFEIRGTASATDKNIVIDWCAGAGSSTWHTAGVEMSMFIGPFIDYPYATLDIESIPDDIVTFTLRARTYDRDGSQLAEEMITLHRPGVGVIAPNGGEYFATGKAMTISWEVVHPTPELTTSKIYLNAYPECFESINSNGHVDETGHGTYVYRVPSGARIDEHCRIFIDVTDGNGFHKSDYSDGEFTIEYRTKPDDDPLPPDLGKDDPSLPFPTSATGRETFLAPPTPNPFNPQTGFRFGLRDASEVSLVIYDAVGRRVRTFYDRERLNAGEYWNTWAGMDDKGNAVSSGVYFLKFNTREYSNTQKLILLK